MNNLFENLSSDLPAELIEVLVRGQGLRVERIVSTGHVSPPEFWYQQEEAEWVVVLKGEAKLQFEGDKELVALTPGDSLLIPAHQKHRVEWTSESEPTVWLAIFFTE